MAKTALYLKKKKKKPQMNYKQQLKWVYTML